MTEAASEQGPSTLATADKYGIMSSIAAVREIIQKNHLVAPENDAMEELSQQKQKSYQEKLQLQEEIKKQRTLLKDLSSKAERANEEAQREKSLRLALEEAQSKLEDHRKELANQLETTKASQAVTEEKIVRFHEDLDKQNIAFDQERAKMDTLVKTLQAREETNKQEIGQLEARLLTSQQETKDAKSFIAILTKRVESADDRLKGIVQGYKSVVDSLKKRIEMGQVDSIEDLKKRLSDAESNFETTLEMKRNAREDLLSFRQFSEKRNEGLLSQQAKEQICQELESTEASLKEAEQEHESREQAVVALEEDTAEKTGADKSKHTSELAKARLEVKKSNLQVRKVLKKLGDLYKRRLELSQKTLSGTEQDLETMKERLQAAKEEATKAQAEMESFQSKKAALISGGGGGGGGGGDKNNNSKKRAAEKEATTSEQGETAAAGEKRQKQS